VNPRLFGSFVEHLGRCVYTGIFEPGHTSADEHGLRGDVLALVRELGVTLVRYPGGNFVSGYRWEDGVGPVDARPRRLELAWRTIETNQFGLGEFMRFIDAVGAEPMLAVNLGTRGIQEATDLLEYCNHPAGTALSDLRRAHGTERPWDIPLWCLGNELDGPWQIGRKTATEYGRLAAETGKAMRLVDPRVRLVACGSSGSQMDTFAAWEADVLDYAYDYVDYVSCHAYYSNAGGDLDSFLASAMDMEHVIDSVVATVDHVRAKRKANKRLELSFDEWNVWHGVGQDPATPPWEIAPRQLEEYYDVADAVVVGSLLITLLRRCDRVTAACLAQLVNVIAPIMTEPGGPAWRQTTFYPFADVAAHARGEVLWVRPRGDTHETARFGEVDLLHATAVSRADGSVAVFAVNRDTTKPLELTVDVRPLGATRVIEQRVLADADHTARNTMDDPHRVAPVSRDTARLDAGRLVVELPPVSWNVIVLGTGS